MCCLCAANVLQAKTYVALVDVDPQAEVEGVQSWVPVIAPGIQQGNHSQKHSFEILFFVFAVSVIAPGIQQGTNSQKYALEFFLVFFAVPVIALGIQQGTHSQKHFFFLRYQSLNRASSKVHILKNTLSSDL
jgi:hypothetical protein